MCDPMLGEHLQVKACVCVRACVSNVLCNPMNGEHLRVKVYVCACVLVWFNAWPCLAISWCNAWPSVAHSGASGGQALRAHPFMLMCMGLGVCMRVVCVRVVYA